MSIKLNQLRVFCAVAESKSIHKAAAALGLSQPTVSGIIRELEQTGGGPLMTRSQKGIEMTPLGTFLLQRARGLVADVSRLEGDLQGFHDGSQRPISICTTVVAANSFMPFAVKKFQAEMPNVQVSVAEIPERNAFITGMREGAYDFAVMEGMEYFFPMPDDIEMLASVDLSMMLVCRASHPLASATSLAQLSEADWLLPIDRTPARDKAVAEFFAGHGLRVPRQPVRSSSTFSSLRLLQVMDLIGGITVNFRKNELDNWGLVRIGIPEEIPPVKVGIFVKPSHVQSGASNYLIQCFRDVMNLPA